MKGDQSHENQRGCPLWGTCNNMPAQRSYTKLRLMAFRWEMMVKSPCLLVSWGCQSMASISADMFKASIYTHTMPGCDM